MEFRTIKEDGQVQEEIKNHDLFVMQNVSIVKKKPVPLSRLSKRNIMTRLPTPALVFITSERSEIKRNCAMMGSQVNCWCTYAGVLENHNLTIVCVVVTRYFL